MIDPERISKRGLGLAAQLLRAGADERPSESGVERTLAALGLSAVVLTSSSVASAAAGAKLASVASGGAAAMSSGAGTVNAVSALLLVKWIGIGVVSGVVLSGAAAVATRQSAPSVESATVAPRPLPRARPATPTSATLASTRVAVGPPIDATSVVPSPPALRASTANAPDLHEAPSEPDVGAPLAAEVAFVDRGRSLFRAGRTVESLASLDGYEQEFAEARLLPEVLFLRLQAYERLGRVSDARRAAQRLVTGFPKSPHATRARTFLAQ